MLSQTHLQLLQGRARIAKIHIQFGLVRSIDAIHSFSYNTSKCYGECSKWTDLFSKETSRT